MAAQSLRPVIGISCYVEPASWGLWSGVPAALIPYAYVRKVEAAGAIALVIPPRLDGDEDWAAEIARRLDGLILAGGVDVESSRYGEPPHHSVQAARRDRDAAELSLAAVSAALDLPVLGMQVMAVAAGGSLEQHLPDRVGHLRHSPGDGVYGQHGVRTEPSSKLAAIVGSSIDVPTYHHQAVTTHPGYLATAWDPDDGTIEAMEDPAARFRLAVQWHPEISEDPRLFNALIDAALAVAS
jgi:putative glutamine amidotransferase